MSTVRDNRTERRYELHVDDQVAGFSDYALDGGRIAILHTEVGDTYAGRALGKKLVTGMLSDVEQRGLEVVPMCPYVRKVIAGNRARYLHLVPEDVRDMLGLTPFRA